MLVSVNYTIKFDEIPRTTQKSLTEDILLEMGLLCAEVEGAAHRLDPGSDQNIFKAMETIDQRFQDQGRLRCDDHRDHKKYRRIHHQS